MTPEYSAPETFKNVFLKESDYYSFGITLYELFCGYTPYANMQPEEIEQFISVQHIPYPEKMSDRLKDFITALTYYDISNRNNKNNPNRRWTYEEVKSWIDGENLVIPGEGIGNSRNGSVPGYDFQGKTYTNPDLLVGALAEHWEDGKNSFSEAILQDISENGIWKWQGSARQQRIQLQEKMEEMILFSGNCFIRSTQD